MENIFKAHNKKIVFYSNCVLGESLSKLIPKKNMLEYKEMKDETLNFENIKRKTRIDACEALRKGMGGWNEEKKKEIVGISLNKKNWLDKERYVLTYLDLMKMKCIDLFNFDNQNMNLLIEKHFFGFLNDQISSSHLFSSEEQIEALHSVPNENQQNYLSLFENNFQHSIQLLIDHKIDFLMIDQDCIIYHNDKKDVKCILAGSFNPLHEVKFFIYYHFFYFFLFFFIFYFIFFFILLYFIFIF